jgi:hypothetical protein
MDGNIAQVSPVELERRIVILEINCGMQLIRGAGVPPAFLHNAVIKK